MGVNASREATEVANRCSTVYRATKQMKEVKDVIRPSEPSPREFVHSGELRERKASEKPPWEQPSSLYRYEKFGQSSDRQIEKFGLPSDRPDTSSNSAAKVEGLPPKPIETMGMDPFGGDPFGDMVAAPDYQTTAGFSTGFATGSQDAGYRPLNLQEDPAEDYDGPACKGRCTQKMIDWHDAWLHSVECGELDIYTCLGLSNCFSWSPDTRKITAKVIGVCVLQLLVPCILLQVELAAGFSYMPRHSGLGFRLMGVCLYLYSLYSMYNNALDECRSKLLQWAIDQEIPMGYWLAMLMGEITNVFVSLILVLTLFVIFVGVEKPADLILNAVAVNFLGAVDGEFVDDEMKQDALVNFKELFFQYGADDDGIRRKEHKCINVGLNIMLFIIVVSGLVLAVVFLFAPTNELTPLELEQESIGGRGTLLKLI